METLHPIKGFRSEPNLSRHGRPATPPYTPAKPKRRLERSDSPASSIHPAETSSPARKFVKRAATDDIHIEELLEGDIGYLTDIDVVYPDELEEIDDATDLESEAGADAKSDSGISTYLAKLRCDDEVEMQKKRRERRLSRRTGSRVFKRSHSQSVKSDGGATDNDAMYGQDVEAGARRLRRRVQEPSNGVEQVFEHRSGSSGPGEGQTLRDTEQEDLLHGGAITMDTEAQPSDAMEVE